MDDERRLSFGERAEMYDRRRPDYPDALVDDVLERTGRAPDDLRALEVGAGTGKATVQFARRGVAVAALEPSPAMAALARGHAAGFRRVNVIEAEFESWSPPADPFGLVFSAQAWHWIDPARRYRLARAALAAGGVLAAFWNRPDWGRCVLRDELDAAYARHAPELSTEDPMRPRAAPARDGWMTWTAEIDAAAGLGEPELRSYRRELRHTAAGYVELLRTHSDHAVLAEDRRDRLLDGVAAVIEAAGGAFALPLVTRLCLARAV